MKTVVYQSYRTQNVSVWIGRCLQSVEQWSADRGFDYRFIDDRLFDYVPSEYRARVQNKIVLSDLARLLVGQELLTEGYDRAVWVDADVLVFAPGAWEVPTTSNYYFCHELWPQRATAKGIQFDVRVNNAVAVFSAGNSFLAFYIDACRRILDHVENPNTWDLGVRFLTQLKRAMPLPLLMNVGMFGPAILTDLVQNTNHVLASYVRASKVPLVAANLCGSLRDKNIQGIVLTDEVCAAAVDLCVNSGGEVIHRYLTSRPE